jgi:hypothetical protein
MLSVQWQFDILLQTTARVLTTRIFRSVAFRQERDRKMFSSCHADMHVMKYVSDLHSRHASLVFKESMLKSSVNCKIADAKFVSYCPTNVVASNEYRKKILCTNIST